MGESYVSLRHKVAPCRTVLWRMCVFSEVNLSKDFLCFIMTFQCYKTDVVMHFRSANLDEGRLLMMSSSDGGV